jgi:hypothetical protein
MSDELYHNILKACRHISDDTSRSDASHQHKKYYRLLDKFYETMKDDIYMNSMYSMTWTRISTATRHVDIGGSGTWVTTPPAATTLKYTSTASTWRSVTSYT